jgi:hypothetical protein
MTWLKHNNQMNRITERGKGNNQNGDISEENIGVMRGKEIMNVR